MAVAAMVAGDIVALGEGQHHPHIGGLLAGAQMHEAGRLARRRKAPHGFLEMANEQHGAVKPQTVFRGALRFRRTGADGALGGCPQLTLPCFTGKLEAEPEGVQKKRRRLQPSSELDMPSSSSSSSTAGIA